MVDKKEKSVEEVQIPSGVTVTVDAKSVVKAVGPKGEAKKQLRSVDISIVVKGNIVELTSKRSSRNELKVLYAFVAHVKNLIKGVTKGFVYKLKVCSGHFPITAAVKGSEFLVKNLFGEALPRILKIKEGAKVTVTAAIVEVSGTNLETVSQVSADIENLVRRTDYDRRVFQDGIYITDKDGDLM